MKLVTGTDSIERLYGSPGSDEIFGLGAKISFKASAATTLLMAVQMTMISGYKPVKV
mgnify:CR=1 FL=1